MTGPAISTACPPALGRDTGPAPVDSPWKSLRAPRERTPVGKLAAVRPELLQSQPAFWTVHIPPPPPKHGIPDTPLVSVTIHVEGGGDRTQLKAQCRKGFKELLTKAGFAGRLPKVVPCGSRNDAFRSFEIALRNEGDGYPILLVDSEAPVVDANPSGAWRHLGQRDDWTRPPGAADDQAQLMVTTMETWLLADRQTLIDYFPAMNASSLPPDTDLESRRKEEVVEALQRATQRSRKRRYHKGNHSFDLLGRVEPEELKGRLPHFRRFIETLDARLPSA